VKTQQGVPSQPSNLRVVESRATSITLAWEQPSHSGDNIVSYELYWNDTFSGDVSPPFFINFTFFANKLWICKNNMGFFIFSLLTTGLWIHQSTSTFWMVCIQILCTRFGWQLSPREAREPQPHPWLYALNNTVSIQQ